MPLYFIEMGQGVIARPEMRVRTSCLSSCTMVTGWSATTNFGGAFHYPARHHKNEEVLAAMALWVFYLKPTVIKLLFADSKNYGMGTKESDRNFMHAWVTRETGLIATSDAAVAAHMALTANLQFHAGNANTVPGDFGPKALDLSNMPAGDYSYHNFILVGRKM